MGQAFGDKMNIGDKVKCLGEYTGNTGTIVETQLNVFNQLLYIVQLDQDPNGYQPCFYFQELEVIDA